MSDSPTSVLYIRPDTFGDIVLFEPALRELMAAWPKARHALLVRPGYETLAPLFPDQVHWQVSTLNPFKQSPAEGRQAFEVLLEQVSRNPPDIVVACTLNRTWLEVALASALPNARHVALGRGQVDPVFMTALSLEFGKASHDAFEEYVSVVEDALEWENNFRLVDYLLGRKVGRHLPRLSVPTDEASRATAWLKDHGLNAGEWVALFPAGVANVGIKAWSPGKFAETAVWLHREHHLPLALLGHKNEQALLEQVAAGIAAAGIFPPPIWLGEDGEIVRLAALLQSARLYFGNDTGAMHIAAALARPVVAIFGGGHGLRFKPVARQAVTIVHPLPCFGCRWDCHFGDAPCVRAITVADAQSALNRLFAAGDSALDFVHEASNLSSESIGLIAASTPRFERLQQDRLDRQYKIEELTHLDREKDQEISELKHAAEERKVEMESIKTELEAECAQKDTEITELKHEADTKDREISALKGEADDKDREISALKHEADAKDREIASLKSEADTKDAEIEQLKATCNEREGLIFRLTDIVKDFQKQVAELNSALEERDRHVAAAHAERDLIKANFAALPPDAGQYAEWLHDRNHRIATLENAARVRDVELRDLQSSIDNINRGYGHLEQVKRYGKWLYEKEAVIQHLKRVCDERETLIGELAARAAGLARLRQAWRAGKEYMRQKWWRPLGDTLYRNLVESYWMQLGVLRQYEPRPIAWDRTLPRRGRLPETSLPAMVIVTPSFNQDKFLESTILSVLNQNYPKLRYRVQDGGSKDRSPEIIRKYESRLAGWYCGKDRGRSDAIRTGFDQMPGADEDIMAWLNSDDFIAPRVLRFVAEYFTRHPSVDVIYGNRIIIDDHDQEIGRWIMPPHNAKCLEWIDYVPQETLFWRRRAWNVVGGLDPTFHFALDWDLLVRFQQARLKIVRVPHFLGCFRLHSEQKTSVHISTTGHEEMTRIRNRIHGPHHDVAEIDRHARKSRLGAALCARTYRLGLRY